MTKNAIPENVRPQRELEINLDIRRLEPDKLRYRPFSKLKNVVPQGDLRIH